MGLYVEYINCDIDKVVCHKIGNKFRGEGVAMSSKPMVMDEYSRKSFFNYILGEFVRNECLYNLYHEADLSLNMVYYAVSRIFENPKRFIEHSQEISRHLYERSTHPKIKEGELFIVYLKDCILNGDTLDAIGIFKSETKNRGLQLNKNDDNLSLTTDQYIDIAKLDRGCIIYNTEKKNGYVAQVVDNIGKGTAGYWFNDFLHVVERRDNSYFTRSIVDTALRYIHTGIEVKYEVTEINKAELLSLAADYLNKSDTFDLTEFCRTVFDSVDNGSYFKEYLECYLSERGVVIPESFTLCARELKRKQRRMKYNIKIDKNIEISLKGVSKKIEEGQDSDGKQFYKVYINN